MDNKNGTEAIVQPIPPVEVVAPTQTEAEAKIASLEAEKAKLLEERTNYQAAYLKEKAKNDDLGSDENEEDRVRRIIREEDTNKRLAQIDKERELELQKALKENKELKLTLTNKTGVPASMGSHSEGLSVNNDPVISPEQMAQFRAMGKDEKWIEMYKKNLQRNSGRAA